MQLPCPPPGASQSVLEAHPEQPQPLEKVVCATVSTPANCPPRIKERCSPRPSASSADKKPSSAPLRVLRGSKKGVPPVPIPTGLSRSGPLRRSYPAGQRRKGPFWPSRAVPEPLRASWPPIPNSPTRLKRLCVRPYPRRRAVLRGSKRDVLRAPPRPPRIKERCSPRPPRTKKPRLQ